MVVLALANTTEPTQGSLRPRVEAPTPTALCWKCSICRHLCANRPQSGEGLNSHSPQTPPNPAGRKWKNPEAGTAGRPYGHRVTPLTDGRHPIGPVDQYGDRTRLPCHSLTVLTEYQR